MLWLALTIGLVFETSLVWMDALYIVKKPFSIVCVPLLDIEYRKCLTPFTDPTGLGLPMRASLSPPDLFGAKSFCLIEQIMTLGLGHPGRCVFLKKSGARAHATAWHCEYDSEFKTCMTPVNTAKVYDNTRAKPGPTRKTSATNAPIDLESASGTDENEETFLLSDDEKADDLNFWFGEDEGWISRSSRQNPDAENVARVRMPPLEINTLEGLLAPIVDESKYYFAVNSLTSIVTVRWKHSERGLHWDRFTRSKQKVDALGLKKFHSSSSSSLSLHSYAECVARAQRWCCWHSTWIYDTRPMTIAH